MNSGFPSLTGGQDDLEEGFWSSFSNVMMVILKIFLLVIVIMALNNRNLLDDLKHSVRAQEVAQQEAELAATQSASIGSRQRKNPRKSPNFSSKPMRRWKSNWITCNNVLRR